MIFAMVSLTWDTCDVVVAKYYLTRKKISLVGCFQLQITDQLIDWLHFLRKQKNLKLSHDYLLQDDACFMFRDENMQKIKGFSCVWFCFVLPVVLAFGHLFNILFYKTTWCVLGTLLSRAFVGSCVRYYHNHRWWLMKKISNDLALVSTLLAQVSKSSSSFSLQIMTCFSAVISKSGAGQLDLLILDTLFKVNWLCHLIVIFMYIHFCFINYGLFLLLWINNYLTQTSAY